MSRFNHRPGCRGLSLAAIALLAAAAQASVPIHAMDTLDGLAVTSGVPRVVAEGQEGRNVIRFDAGEALSAEEGGPFEFHVDLDDLDLRDYDLLKIEMNASRAATVLLSIDQFPEPGMQARWYVLDALRGPTGWRTFIVDLNLPEEIRGAEEGAPRRITIEGQVKETGRAMQGEARSVLIGPIRAVKKAVDVDWDQRTFDVSAAGDLVYTYPVTISSTHDARVTADVRVEPFQVSYATATVSPRSVTLDPGERETVRVRLTLPDADRFRPLYAERFEVWASARGIADSDVTIVRSSDVIHLPVVVPLPESALQFPLLPTPEALPAELLSFDASAARHHATAYAPANLIAHARQNGIYNYQEPRDDPRFRQALISAAYLYRLTGEGGFLEIGRELLAALPGIREEQARQYRQIEHPLVSHGMVVRWGDGWHFTLGLGWRLVGTQRAPYYYGVEGNGAGGSMGGIFQAFDMLASELTPAERTAFINGFAVPAGVRSRNHYVGDANQQATVDGSALYAGLISRNWPLVAFATSSEHGIPSIVEWTFSDEGRHIRDNYQTYTLRALFFSTELLFQRGIDLYGPYLGRWESAVNWSGRKPFDDGYFWRFIRENRLREPRTLPTPAGLEAVETSGGDIDLRWLDPSDLETWFVVERSTRTDGGFEEIGRSPGTWTGFAGACPDRTSTYYFRVRGTNYRSEPSPYSDVVRARCH